VYLADDVVLRRRVAVKVLHAALAGDQAFLKRFQAEAHTAAALSHPNIMRVLDWGEADDGPILVLEYLGGGSLRSVLDSDGTLTVEQAVTVGLQAGKALDYAHRRGLVHRDVKPANLIFDEEGRLAIADFGLARALAEAAWTEPGGAVLGTARYASPEQVRGQSLDGKADVYALGLVLIEIVCGYVPFTADTTIATLMARLDVHLEAPPEMGPLGSVVEQATNPDPAQRVDAGELVRLLEKAAAQLPAPAPVSLPGSIRPGSARTDSGDPTMLPGASSSGDGAAEPGENGVAHELRPRKRRRIPLMRRPDDSKPRPSIAPGAASRKTLKARLPTAKQVALALIAIALALGISAGAYAVYFYTGRETAVPQLENLPLAEAQAIAKDVGIRLDNDGEAFSETVPPGQTFNQSPAVGDKVFERESVHLKVSKGPAPREVVNTTGQTLEQGRQALADKGFVVTTENKFDEVAPANKILAQSPSSGEQPRGAEIRLVLSGGPEPRTIPDVNGQSFEAASEAVTALGLRVVRGPDGFSDTVPSGRVAATSPGPGGKAARGAAVTITVSKGPNLVAVTDVRGKTVSAASDALAAAGFRVVDVFGPVGGRVFDTTPSAGSKVKFGANVSLYTK